MQKLEKKTRNEENIRKRRLTSRSLLAEKRVVEEFVGTARCKTKEKRERTGEKKITNEEIDQNLALVWEVAGAERTNESPQEQACIKEFDYLAIKP